MHYYVDYQFFTKQLKKGGFMATIRRQLPQSTPARYRALKVAQQKNDIDGAATVLTGPTIARLNTIFPAMRDAIVLIDQRQALSAQSTAEKNVAVAECYLYTRHFMLTVIMAVERGEMPGSVLSLYGLDLVNPALPPMTNDEAVIIAAEKVKSGETARVAAGGTPLPMPTLPQVVTRADAAQAAMNSRSNQADLLDLAQEALAKLTTEVDGVVKKVWDEAETFYNEESAESRRANCRQWGVVYVSDTRTEVKAQALEVANGLAVPVPAAILTQTDVDNTSGTATEDGIIKLKTGFIGTANFELSATGFISQTITAVIDGTTDTDLGEITMLRMP